MIFSKKIGYIVSSRDYAYIRELISSIPMSMETRNKMRNKKVSEKTKEIQRQNNLGEKNPMFGKCNYNIWVKKYGIKIADQKHAEWIQHKKGHIPWNKGKRGCFSKETLKKLSKSSSGKNNGMYGKKHKPKSILKMKNRIFSEKTKNLMKKNHADVSGKNNPMYGKCGKESPKYIKIDINFIKENIHLCNDLQDLSKLTNININTLKRKLTHEFNTNFANIKSKLI